MCCAVNIAELKITNKWGRRHTTFPFRFKKQNPDLQPGQEHAGQRAGKHVHLLKRRAIQRGLQQNWGKLSLIR